MSLNIKAIEVHESFNCRDPKRTCCTGSQVKACLFSVKLRGQLGSAMRLLSVEAGDTESCATTDGLSIYEFRLVWHFASSMVLTGGLGL